MTLLATRPEPASGVQVRGPRRAMWMGVVLLVALVVVVAMASLAVGSRPFSIGTVWQVLWSPDGSDASAIVHELRIPRTWLAIVVGMSLGVAGALMQGHTRNPLADPGLLGVSAGAAFAVVIAIYTFDITSARGYVWFALVGAAIASAAVFAIGSAGGRGPSSLGLVLAGAAVSALLGSVTTALILADDETLDNYRFWAVGSIAGRDQTVAAQVTPFLVVGLLLAVAHAPTLNVLSLGDDVARSLGQRLTLARVTGLVAIMLLTGAATAACGPIAFLGLVVPHLARFVTGPDHRWLVPYAALMGATLLMLADIVGRVVARPGELQVGIVLVLIGGPAFIAIVRRRRLVAL
jgi:iron complex transport system permease protein